MTCERASILIQSSADRALPSEERTALNAHLEGCVACRAEQDTQRRLARLTGRWAAHMVELSDPGEDFAVQVLSRLDRPASSRRWAWLPPAAILLLLGLMPSLLAAPVWLGANVPAWTTSGLLGVLLLYAGFFVQARQRSVS